MQKYGVFELLALTLFLQVQTRPSKFQVNPAKHLSARIEVKYLALLIFNSFATANEVVNKTAIVFN